MKPVDRSNPDRAVFRFYDRFNSILAIGALKCIARMPPFLDGVHLRGARPYPAGVVLKQPVESRPRHVFGVIYPFKMTVPPLEEAAISRNPDVAFAVLQERTNKDIGESIGGRVRAKRAISHLHQSPAIRANP